MVRRWVNEVTEGVSSQHEMVQYHALSLLYQIKAHDRLAVSKLVSFIILYYHTWRLTCVYTCRSPPRPRKPVELCPDVLAMQGLSMVFFGMHDEKNTPPFLPRTKTPAPDRT